MKKIGLGLLIVSTYGVPMIGVLAISEASEAQSVQLVSNFNPRSTLDTTQVIAGDQRKGS